MKSSYKDLEVWKLSMDLVETIYEITNELPDSEKFGLISQLRRAAVSVPSNIAEGQRRYSKQEMIRFASISLGSVGEIETQLELCERIYEVDCSTGVEKCEVVSRMLLALIKSQR